MSVAAFSVIAFMLTMYVLLDGYDLGAAAIAPLVARSDRERAGVMASIGPFWNGNEVWLIAAGASLFALFPVAYASSFSGFYLPFIIVLWLLMIRGIALELRNHFASPLWHQFWDAAFALSSALLILLFGVALGNLLRGVPLNSAGYFLGTFAFLLNPYALLVGVLAVATLALHGAAFLVIRVEGALGERASRALPKCSFVVFALYIATAIPSARMHPATNNLWLYVLPALSLAALAAVAITSYKGHPLWAFVMSTFFIAALLTTAAVTMFPYLLPSFPAGSGGISIFNAAPSSVALTCALTVSMAGIVLVLIYGLAVWRRMGGKIQVE